MGLKESDNSIDEENNNPNYTLSYCVLYYFSTMYDITHPDVYFFVFELDVNKN